MSKTQTNETKLDRYTLYSDVCAAKIQSNTLRQSSRPKKLHDIRETFYLTTLKTARVIMSQR